MRRFIIALGLLPIFASCAHLPADLQAWALDKSLRVGECAARELTDRGAAKACLGPNFVRDLGTEACEQAHALLEALPPTPADKAEED